MKHGDDKMRPEYEILFDRDWCQVNHSRLGYCEHFYGPTFKQDAIRYIKRVGGSNATWGFRSLQDALEGKR